MSGLPFTTLRAMELVDAREEVIAYAEEDLYATNLREWQKACDTAAKAGKPKPQRPKAASDRDWCREQSRETRIRRERDSTYWNDLVSANPLY